MTHPKFVALAVVLALCLPAAAGAETYEYDVQGRLTKVVYPDGRSIAYTYDPAGNVTEVKADPAAPAGPDPIVPPGAAASSCSCGSGGGAAGALGGLLLGAFVVGARRRRIAR